MNINYRGSFGFGLDYQKALVGKCGRLDVDDCVEAILRAPEIGFDPENVFLYGGSHGGYLITKLVEDERLSGKIRASIAINSVIYMNLMIYNSDIPEWAWASFRGTEYNLQDEVSLSVF
jgi:acylaminoacyl-peptidase